MSIFKGARSLTGEKDTKLTKGETLHTHYYSYHEKKKCVNDADCVISFRVNI